MNRKTVSSVMKLRDADGRPLWHTNLREGQPDLLMGYPITEAEDMPDIAADSYSLAFGDFRRGYIIVDRIGTRVLRDPFSAKPYVLFYTTKRVGGNLGHYDAIKLMKFGTS
jgi:HK97 family phage major capsid protein